MDPQRLFRIAEEVAEAAGRKTLSPAMKDHLKWMRDLEQSSKDGPAKITMSRPGHPENLSIHNALLKRGLIAEAPDGSTTVTEAGYAEPL